ncbi:MAG: helix-turn-helix transcriptional regulator [Polyangiaceae bacterium]|nr:helix-turn-helix transcriptional regulator [Polyangiaceae bacterium]
MVLAQLSRKPSASPLRQAATRQEVAAEGLTYRYLQELEQGRRNPSLKMLHDLADTLEVRVVDLLDVGERKTPVKLAELDVKPPPRGRKPKPR